MKRFLIGFALLNTISQVKNLDDNGFPQCNQGFYRCADNSKCVNYKNLCDFNKDCEDLSDENFSMCQTLYEKRGTCQAGMIYSQHRNCLTLSDICNEQSGYFDQELPTLCNNIKNGLKPFEEVVAVRKEIASIKAEESKLGELFSQLATSFHLSNWIVNASHCPPLYVNIGEKCVALFSLAQVSWPEAKQFCKSISGTLGVLSEMTDYHGLQNYLKNNDFSSNFWIGGKLEKRLGNISTWTWLDGNNIEMGAPYWTTYKTPICQKRNNSDVCYEYSLMPQGIVDGCLAMDYQYYYYFSDANCFEKRSPLCFHN